MEKNYSKSQVIQEHSFRQEHTFSVVIDVSFEMLTNSCIAHDQTSAKNVTHANWPALVSSFLIYLETVTL